MDAVSALIEALDAIDGDVGKALASAGLSTCRQLIEEGGQGEVTRVAFARLAQDCVLAFHYHACRRDALKPHPVRNFRLMCIALLACPDLKTAIEVAGQFQHMAFDGHGRLDLEVDGNTATLVLDTRIKGRGVGDMLVIMFGLASFHRMFGWLTHEEIRLDSVMLNFPAANERLAFNDLLQMEPEFDRAFNGFQFPAYYLERPVVRTYDELSTLFTLFPFDLLPPGYDSQSLKERAAAATSAALSRAEKPPSLAQLATMFGLTTATFRRRLTEEGSSLTTIRHDCRSLLAMRLLVESKLTVKEIAYRVQFSDVAAFRRAFRNWTGQSPNTYRQTGISPRQ
ncbi:hypothetical protein MB02_11780 [Croceicoccus estronivorus]|uniref:helix-turn-helix transcriptional regulator n=1 Tax=Croceicoccus estronivorus TaxID=1172626 RepID=UPI00082AE75D|nr:AraC family transcriptional regulator [Croceicoccus estronivorus]OCC23311.1 hypothetical protein MB02_11780 [Croceicoccus estronivorus]